ncbi:MAG: glycosyltransferase [Clostridia bacterium]|nr:glycosyltransferase [Clostridia bacterium]
MNQEKNFISAVVYVHNAGDRVAEFLRTILHTLENNFVHSEIICVNDASEDDSLQKIRAASAEAKSASVSVINMSYFHGLEMAMNAGVDLAIGDFVFEFDHTWLDFDEGEIMKAYRRCLAGYDIVSASPQRRERLSSRVFYRMFDRFSHLKYEMSTESFRILSRRVINRIGSENQTVLYRKAVYASSGLKTDQIKYTPKTSAVPAGDRRERSYRAALAADSLILFTELGYRFSMIMTAIMLLIALLTLVYTVVAYFAVHPVEGWTTTILFLSVCFIGLFGIQTIIIKYLQLLVDMVYKRKHYSFESIEKLTK